LAVAVVCDHDSRCSASPAVQVVVTIGPSSSSSDQPDGTANAPAAAAQQGASQAAAAAAQPQGAAAAAREAWQGRRVTAWDLEIDDIITSPAAFVISQQQHPEAGQPAEGAAGALMPGGDGRGGKGYEGAAGSLLADRAEQGRDGFVTVNDSGASQSPASGSVAATPGMPWLGKWLLRLAAAGAMVGVQLWARHH
jgi:hypothetical protein